MALRASGNFFNGSFGAVANTITVQYRHKVQGGEYGDWQAMTATASGNTYTAEADLTGLDYRVAHTFQVQAVDKVRSCASVERTVRTYPLFDWGENDFNFNVPVHFAQGATGLDHTHNAGDILGGLAMELLWENASPSSSFAAQTIPLSALGGEVCSMYYVPFNDSDFILVPYGCVVHAHSFDYSANYYNNLRMNTRGVESQKDGSIKFGANYKKTMNTAPYTDEQTSLVPMKIYGIKGVTE
jgi:hypothetical protein